MDMARLRNAIRELDRQGHERVTIVLASGEVEIPLGEDNAALTFADEDGTVTFRIGGRARTTPLPLDQITSVRGAGPR